MSEPLTPLEMNAIDKAIRISECGKSHDVTIPTRLAREMFEAMKERDAARVEAEPD